MDKNQLVGEIVDKINLLNKIQIDKMDQYKSILRTSNMDDLVYLLPILNKELAKYPEHLEVK